VKPESTNNKKYDPNTCQSPSEEIFQDLKSFNSYFSRKTVSSFPLSAAGKLLSAVLW
jgi:hypothetical protein